MKLSNHSTNFLLCLINYSSLTHTSRSSSPLQHDGLRSISSPSDNVLRRVESLEAAQDVLVARLDEASQMEDGRFALVPSGMRVSALFPRKSLALFNEHHCNNDCSKILEEINLLFIIGR